MKNDMIKDLYEKAKNLSESPGVYKFLDEKGSIIYVGKAKRLRRRVVSYFQPGRAHDARIERMISDIRHIETIQVTSEAEALIFEAGLIKDHTPKYNIDLKDDKSYPFLKLTVNEGYPRLFVTRRKVADGAEYYGPYADAGLLKEAVIFMKKVFPLRTCRKMGKKLCL
ncbi:MAG TPA: GIY-YIG nuclease family protein, partial [Candidatus Omnitrophota bacterium]|nr:GIY-YIG nuclease family protein [Candidatus Omnitrophota bacterium]